MEFTIQTNYDQKAMTAMTRALRKTVRQKQSNFSLAAALVMIILGVIFIFTAKKIDANFFFNIIAVAIVAVTLLCQDQISGYVARKRMLPGTTSSTTVFTNEGYRSVTAFGESNFSNKSIFAIAEDTDYLILIYSDTHAQVYNKHNLSGGTIEEFYKLLRRNTNLTIQKI